MLTAHVRSVRNEVQEYQHTTTSSPTLNHQCSGGINDNFLLLLLLLLLRCCTVPRDPHMSK
jgi:hypothetical protein